MWLHSKQFHSENRIQIFFAANCSKCMDDSIFTFVDISQPCRFLLNRFAKDETANSNVHHFNCSLQRLQ